MTNPLNAIPGPWYAKFTGLPGTIATLKRQQVQYYHRLHQQYGPFVRASPGQVFVSDVKAFKTIHKVGSQFTKAEYYHYFGPTEAGSPPYGLFQMTDQHAHSQRRKLLGRGFTSSSLRADWEDMVREKVTVALEGMTIDAKIASGEVDMRKWWILMACDVVSKLMFGESFDALKAGKVGHRRCSQTGFSLTILCRKTHGSRRSPSPTPRLSPHCHSHGFMRSPNAFL